MATKAFEEAQKAMNAAEKAR